MGEYTRDEAVAFIDALRLTLGDKVGYQWMVGKLKDLSAYIEAVADENEQLKAYLESTGAREAFEASRRATDAD